MLNCLMMPIKMFLAFIFFCLILCCTCFVQFVQLLSHFFVLPTVSYSKTYTFFVSPILCVMSPTACFCSVFNICSLCVNDCKHMYTVLLFVCAQPLWNNKLVLKYSQSLIWPEFAFLSRAFLV